MSNAPKRVYMDSATFIDIVKSEVGTAVENGRQDDAWYALRLLEAHRDKEIKVLTSALTIAECTHGGEGDVSEAVQALFTKLLTSGDYVELVQMSPFIATDARDLRWKHNINLKGADGIHAASALAMDCEEFLTVDGRFHRLQKSGQVFAQLGMEIKTPRNTQCLPAKYRQSGFDYGQVH